ncbi:uncharacterized protein LOC106668092 [Cimex lectularius]|uniref:Uncharacterized protein n=1 Tax=Cimex lectularius TaxID=79782 RepID=A0A8I6RXU7_CIMLE|nr:uncharacterized protein LOC106668092 [Cimex lectularius]
MTDLNKKTTIVKIVALILASVCYGLLIGFHASIQTPYERLLICAVFAGFLVLYIALVIGVFTGREVDKDLNSVWALYGFAAYIGAGVLCIIMYSDNSSTEGFLGVATGAVSIVQGLVVGLDAWFLQNN